MDTTTKKKLLAALFFGILVIAMPIAIYLVQNQHDIRPRALTGQADFKLTGPTAALSRGQEFDVTASIALQNEPGKSLKASGVDLTLLYDKDKLEIVSVKPNVPPPPAIAGPLEFTDAPVATYGAIFPAEPNYKFARVTVVARKSNKCLLAGIPMVATIRFKALTDGEAVIKYPDNKDVLQVVGIEERSEDVEDCS